MLAHCRRDGDTVTRQCVTHLLSSISVTRDEVDINSGETVVDRQHKAKARNVVAPSDG